MLVIFAVKVGHTRRCRAHFVAVCSCLQLLTNQKSKVRHMLADIHVHKLISLPQGGEDQSSILTLKEHKDLLLLLRCADLLYVDYKTQHPDILIEQRM